MTSSRPRRRARMLLLPALLVALIGGCTGDDADPEEVPASTASPTGEPQAQPTAPSGDTEEDLAPDLEPEAAIGEPVEAGRFELVVDDYSCDTPPAEAAAGSCRLTLTARNDTDTDQSVDTTSTLLLDEAATEYAPVEAVGDPAAMASLPPGETATVVLVYDVPESATIVAARVRDDPADEGRLVDLANN